ncbi:glycosyltransferase [Thioalkalivibrio sp. ALJ9]|uniref:glycosyltransferase n=1 Tax=Thioalkalivibrio sp. ALJ9 TaxID=1158758 RepID=UPI0003786B09|nr:glycosyltransferase [Thioalkalivibrio sp. ALJ9]
MTAERLAVLVAYTGDGGVERMMNHLLQGFTDAGVPVDLLLLKSRGGHVQGIPPGVNVIRLEAPTSLLALPAVYRYLRATRPAALLAAKDRAGRVALLARRLARVPTRVVLRMGMHLSGSLADKSALQRLARYLPVRWLYPWADKIITVAPAIADDLANIGHLPRERFKVIPNPTVSPALVERARQTAHHDWLADNGKNPVPVIVAAGRLRPQKDFATLIRAFARLRAKSAMRLIILGEGGDRRKLERLAHELGVEQDVDLAGFRENPLPFMYRADVFVLSSRFEGAPNVLVEAMALGTPVVATDCPSGPRTLLEDGRHGPLVPVGDDAALAHGILQVLDTPTAPEQLKAAVSAYTIEASTRQYLDALGISPR